MTTHFFAPTMPTHLSHVDTIRGLYPLAGLNEPDYTAEVERLIQAQPDSHTVAQELAQEALTTTDPETFIVEALDKFRTAQAADELRGVFTATFDAALAASIPARIDEAVSDLEPAFTKLVRDFTKAAQALPERDPLDENQVIDLDLSKPFKAAKNALLALARYAALHGSPVSSGRLTAAPSELGSILAIVELPTAAVEILDEAQRLSSFPQPENGHELAGTRTIRRLSHALKDNPDHALIDIARGKFPGVTFALASTEGMTERIENADTAYLTERQRRTARIL